jgi:hypothetical protein
MNGFDAAFRSFKPPGGLGILHRVTRTRVVWKWEDEAPDGEGVGPVWVDTFGVDPKKPEKSEQWEQWVRRSEAEQFAKERGFEIQRHRDAVMATTTRRTSGVGVATPSC